MTVLVCSDLDRTLIYSAAAFGPGPLPELECVEIYDGAPLSHMTANAVRELAALAAETVFVPVTTRTPEQYRRVRLPVAPAYAICANGGHLLVDGVDDAAWSAAVRSRVTDGAAPLAEVAARLSGGDFVLRRRTASDLFAYAVVDRAALPADWIDDLAGWCAERNWRTSLQGRKVYCLPAGLTKAAAAAEVARRTGATVTLAAGDSLLDRDLLDSADAAVRPAHGELHTAGWTGADVTAAAGIRAGEEIVGWFRTRAAREIARRDSRVTRDP
ncbi:HAD family hydrolase [Actinomadura rayongensis]|uniref:HAD family hydrolase n=1 Tax=Actinomadura rayongensis TaxID=1429076 RepID=A0A6I4VZK9_9ACTN|nr:HAD family hydrolase [Actinomadura rayongensis]